MHRATRRRAVSWVEDQADLVAYSSPQALELRSVTEEESALKR